VTRAHDVWRFTYALVLWGGVLGAVGCSSTQAAQPGTGGSGFGTGGSGFVEPTAQSSGAISQGGGAIAQTPECNQTDSTYSCCLKRHPGQPEYCGEMAPNAQPPKQGPNRLPPPVKIPSAEEKKRRKKVCQEYYEQCIAKGGEDLERFTEGHSRCQDCYGDCEKTGLWPGAVNEHPCPKVSQ